MCLSSSFLILSGKYPEREMNFYIEQYKITICACFMQMLLRTNYGCDCDIRQVDYSSIASEPG